MNSSNSILFIVNPFSGKTKKKNFPLLVEKVLGETSHIISVKYTEKAGHATSLAQEAVRENMDIVVAVGGDGTVNEVTQGLVNSNTALGIIPAGSGNGLAMHLGLGRNIEKALTFFREPKTAIIDTGKVNDQIGRAHV